jgi:hypothetical protein
VILAGGVLVNANPASATSHNSDKACGAFFDDFAYSSATDPAIAAHGWTVRDNAGGPGVPGASWLPSNVSFPTVGDHRVLQLSATTDGTTAGTSQAEMYQQRKFFEGTYASRVRFMDAPITGASGDPVVQTFFTITPLAYDLDPNYSEMDFEYLPNGGWGETRPTLYETTWETYRADPWFADNVSAAQHTSHDGWHDLVIQVAGGHVKYYVDGALVADHSGRYYPETQMSINYNLWFINLASHTGGPSTYHEQVDWLYFAEGKVISPKAATERVERLRKAGTTHADGVGGCTRS